MSKIINFFVEKDDGFYVLTHNGVVFFAILLVALIVIAAFVFDRGTVKHSAKEIAFAGVALAIAYGLSCIKLFEMPYGGSVCLCSMLFVCIIGYFYGPKMGLMAALAYGILQFIQSGGSYMLSPMQVLCDYIFAFMGLGVAGFFHNSSKNGLIKGYIAGVIMRLVFSSIAGYLYWMSYMPESFPKALKFAYPVIYNGAYLGVEAVITVAILAIPAVCKTVNRVKIISE